MAKTKNTTKRKSQRLSGGRQKYQQVGLSGLSGTSTPATKTKCPRCQQLVLKTKLRNHLGQCQHSICHPEPNVDRMEGIVKGNETATDWGMFDDDEGDIGFGGVEDQNAEVGPPAKYLKTTEESGMTTNGYGEGAECEQSEN
jgi:hypothetical protein